MAVNFGNKYDRFYVALGLPIKEDCHTIDYEAFRSLVRYFLTDDFIGIGGGLIVNPEAGEIFTMTREEKRKIMAIAAEENNGKVPMFCGVINADPYYLGDEAKDAMAEGADGIFVMPPMGCLDVTTGWDVRGFPEVFTSNCGIIADAVGDVPFIIHGAGPRDPVYGLSYPPDTVDFILDHFPNIVGWKMMYNFRAIKDVGFHIREREKQGKPHVGLLQSSAHHFYEDYFYDLLDGSVSCFWNYSKEPNIELITALRAGNYGEAKKFWLEKGLYNLHNYVGRSHARLHTVFKVAAWLKGLYPTPYLRLPMILPLKSEIDDLRVLLTAAGQPVISEDRIMAVYNKLPR
ncbi:dihydrodipicolinate synthase family protein [Breznakiella homolactica]|uniref:Dihydrodipicolinate synthase family protein n=1 Tax=Breznakiella homolactica TaxID=2798577 RepID=A0A7T7XMS3_9SPIR|nr:dihydrodipicolinate synthase family protein [Breznakiella homolactica]QQO09103.1 dihydrodipicolinate synthase family protein [Breznakiella homolactica]